MRRCLFNLLSLLLFVAACALWARSHWATHCILWHGSQDYCGVLASRGRLELWWDTVEAEILYRDSELGFEYFSAVPRDFDERRVFTGLPVHFDVPGCSYYAGEWHEAYRLRLYLECWVPAAASFPLPAVWLLTYPHRRGRRRARLGLCASCGYDLRATPGGCPECGGRAVPGGGRAPLATGAGVRISRGTFGALDGRPKEH